jgi:hypothetical protein
MQLKLGVDIRKVSPELVLGLIIADGIYRQFNTDMVVTSVVDGRHMGTSKHYLGYAADLRIWGLEGRVDQIVIELQKALTNNFDVVKEVDHIHLEYDPHS